MIGLILYEKYSRKEAHDIFAPNTPFIPRHGSWGFQTVVEIDDRPGDFVFFVTIDTGEGEDLEEGITKEGVFSWKSQTKQSLDDPQIRQLINHDEHKNSIYLFLKSKSLGRYTYFGRLKYICHDRQRENPVYIQWQILEWNISHRDMNQIGLVFQLTKKEISTSVQSVEGMLLETLPPIEAYHQGTSSGDFRDKKLPDYSFEEGTESELFLAGQKIVLAHEKRALIAAGRADQAHRVRHVALIEGIGVGYDIESYTKEGEVKYIVVKTTRGAARTPFYMKRREVEFSKIHGDKFYLYRVYEYDPSHNSGKIFIIKGNIEDTFALTPINYKVDLSLNHFSL